jgi:hypothetical protein
MLLTKGTAAENATVQAEINPDRFSMGNGLNLLYIDWMLNVGTAALTGVVTSTLYKYDSSNVANSALNTFTANVGANTFTASSPGDVPRNGTAVTVFNSGGSLPTPLLGSTTYYICNAQNFLTGNPTAKTFQLATTLANARANNPIVLTGAGSGAQTLIAFSVIAQPVPFDDGTTSGLFAGNQVTADGNDHYYRKKILYPAYESINNPFRPLDGTANVMKWASTITVPTASTTVLKVKGCIAVFADESGSYN